MNDSKTKSLRTSCNRQYGVFLQPDEANRLRKELVESGISYRSLPKRLNNVYVAYMQRFFKGDAALSPDNAMTLYALLGKKPSVAFLKDRALNPQDRKYGTILDPWCNLYEDYANKLRVIYIAQQEIAKKTAILKGLEKIINEYAQK